MTGRAGGQGRWTWQLLLPPGWLHLPVTDRAAGRAALRKLLDRALAHLPRDEVAPARRSHELHLRSLLDEAREIGASDVYVLARLTRGFPVSAGLTVLPIGRTEGEHDLLPRLTAALGDAVGVVSHEQTTLVGAPALRRQRRVRQPSPAADPPGPELWRTHVDWVVALPDDGWLALSFATETDALAAELVELFDAMAASLELHWREPG